MYNDVYDGSSLSQVTVDDHDLNFTYDASGGVSFPQWETRWQIAELLSVTRPIESQYLKILLEDSNAYVRKRAANVKQN